MKEEIISCYFVGSFEWMDLGIKGKRWKSTDNIYGSGFGASDIKLLEAGPGIPSLQKAVGRNELHS